MTQVQIQFLQSEKKRATRAAKEQDRDRYHLNTYVNIIQWHKPH